ATTTSLGNEWLVKWPEEEPAIVLIDPSQNEISRVPCETSSRDVISWAGDAVQIAYADEAPSLGDATRFAGSAFADVSIDSRPSGRPTPSLAERREGYKAAAGLDHVGLTNFSDEHHTWDSGISVDIDSGVGSDLRIARSTIQGRALEINLTRLRAEMVGDGLRAITSLRVLPEGGIAYWQEPASLAFERPGRLISVDLSSVWNEEAQPGFSGADGILVAPRSPGSSQLRGIRIPGDGTKQEFTVKVPFDSDSPRWASYPDRESIAETTGFEWREYDWATGRQVGSTYVTGAGKGIHAKGRAFGRAEGDWNITASLVDNHTGGYNFDVVANHEVTGRTVTISGEEINGDQPLDLFHLTTDGFSVLCAGNHRIYLFRHSFTTGRTAKVREWEKNPGDGPAAFDRAGNRLFVPSEGGYEVFKIRRDSIEKVFDLHFHGSDQYAVTLPDGFYAGSPGCEDFLTLRSQGRDIAAATLAPWRNRPARILEALGGDAEEIAALKRVTNRWIERSGLGDSREPDFSDLTVVRLSRELPLRTRAKKITLEVEVQSGSAASQSMRVSVNGVPVGEAPTRLSLGIGESRTVEIPVTLSSGQNWIEIQVVDTDGRASEPLRFRTICTTPSAESTRYVVALGVSEYSGPVRHLDLAAKDAVDVAALFEKLGGTQRTETLVLTDSEVTRGAVSEIEEFLSSAAEDDEVIVFGAAHGVLDRNLEYVFCSHEFDPMRPAETGISMESLIGAVRKGRARRCLILLDTCQAGAVGEREMQLLAQNQSPAMEVTEINRSPITSIETDLTAIEASRYIEEMFLLPGTLEGIHVIGASSAAGYALEINGVLNGVFTSAVIEGLGEGRADRDGNGFAGVDELEEYLERRVVELTGGRQRPSIVASERDQAMRFPLR
ncbi:MAG: caspase family protein, partial [Verrucomicrobiota bacterium]